MHPTRPIHSHKDTRMCVHVHVCMLLVSCRQRFSLLFYGFGSKRSLLEHFAEEALTDGGVMACDGLAPGVNSKQVCSTIGPMDVLHGPAAA